MIGTEQHRLGRNEIHHVPCRRLHHVDGVFSLQILPNPLAIFSAPSRPFAYTPTRQQSVHIPTHLTAQGGWEQRTSRYFFICFQPCSLPFWTETATDYTFSSNDRSHDADNERNSFVLQRRMLYSSFLIVRNLTRLTRWFVWEKVEWLKGRAPNFTSPHRCDSIHTHRHLSHPERKDPSGPYGADSATSSWREFTLFNCSLQRSHKHWFQSDNERYRTCCRVLIQQVSCSPRHPWVYRRRIVQPAYRFHAHVPSSSSFVSRALFSVNWNGSTPQRLSAVTHFPKPVLSSQVILSILTKTNKARFEVDWCLVGMTVMMHMIQFLVVTQFFHREMQYYIFWAIQWIVMLFQIPLVYLKIHSS